MLPVLTLYRHHILVSHENHGIKRRDRAWPTQQNPKLINHRKLANLKYARKQTTQCGDPTLKWLSVLLGTVLARDGRHTQHVL